MPLTPLELPLTSDPGKFGHDGTARLVNCYPEFKGKSGKIAFPLYVCPGLKLFSTLTDGGVNRGMLATDNELLVVSARLFFSTDIEGTAEQRGAVPGDGLAYFARNDKKPFQVVIVSAGLKFVYEGGDFNDITDPDLPPPDTADYLDGYILYSINDGRMFFSALSEATSIAALDQVEAEGSPDGLRRVFTLGRNAWLPGTETTEIFYNSGETNNPIQRRPGAFFEFGCAAAGSVAELDGNVVMVTDDWEVVLASASGAKRRISNHAVERDIKALADKSVISAHTYVDEGHKWYTISAPTFTWQYDLLTGAWIERESYQLPRWRAEGYAKFNDRHIVGTYNDNTLLEIDSDTYTENGQHLVMTVDVPVHAWPHPIEVNELFVDVLPGQGLNSTDEHVSDPLVMLRVSKNGGKTFGNERTAKIGKIGEHENRARFLQLGTSGEDGFVLRISISAAVARGITGLYADVVPVKP